MVAAAACWGLAFLSIRPSFGPQSLELFFQHGGNMLQVLQSEPLAIPDFVKFHPSVTDAFVAWVGAIRTKENHVMPHGDVPAPGHGHVPKGPPLLTPTVLVSAALGGVLKSALNRKYRRQITWISG